MGQSNKRRQLLICINGTVYRGYQRRRKMYTNGKVHKGDIYGVKCLIILRRQSIKVDEDVVQNLLIFSILNGTEYIRESTVYTKRKQPW